MLNDKIVGDASLSKTDAAIEDLFTDDFNRECVNRAYSIPIDPEDLSSDGTDMIASQVECVLKNRYSRSLDKKLVPGEMLEEFDTWASIDDLPKDTAEKAEALITRINHALLGE